MGNGGVPPVWGSDFRDCLRGGGYRKTLLFHIVVPHGGGAVSRACCSRSGKLSVGETVWRELGQVRMIRMTMLLRPRLKVPVMERVRLRI